MRAAAARLVLAAVLVVTGAAATPSSGDLRPILRAPSASAVSAVPFRYTAEAEADRVAELPGWGPLNNLTMFSGYVTVDADAGRALFYVLLESSRCVDQDPLILWLNGGPGCSSVGGGFMSELGPFFPKEDGKTLQANPWAWNRVANMVFLEVPAFVGFSYSNTSGDSDTGDARVVADTITFLHGLLSRFPHLRRNDLYLSGESYAGHYVPLLAQSIVQDNTMQSMRGAKHGPSLRLKGFIVGNPSTDRVIDRVGGAEFLWAHGFISDATADEIKRACARHEGEEKAGEPLTQRHAACTAAFARAGLEMGPINIYELYADTCLPRQARSEARAMARHLTAAGRQQQQQQQQQGGAAGTWYGALSTAHPGHLGLTEWMVLQWSAGREQAQDRIADRSHQRDRMLAERSQARWAQNGASAAHGGGTNIPSDEPKYDPCVDNEVEAYLNLPEVQKALHVNQTVILPYRWTDCSDAIQYSTEDLWESMLPVYKYLVKSTSLRMLVFSGDVDGMVPLVGTRRWISSLNLDLPDGSQAWAPWFPHTQQVGGYAVNYTRLSFATVRNAGHMVPYVQPERMFYLLTGYLEGKFTPATVVSDNAGSAARSSTGG